MPHDREAETSRRLTRRLVKMASEISGKPAPPVGMGAYIEMTAEIIDYEVPSGEAQGVGLVNNDQFSLMQCFLQAGTEFPEHSHLERELIFVTEGELSLWLDGVEVRIGPGQAKSAVEIEGGLPHRGMARSVVEMICVSFPASETYPRVFLHCVGVPHRAGRGENTEG